ncbi:MAG: hypothetical protein PQJ59_01640 [Spirochaetales bacterium]|nr:hypothetical protein [Spirochaetales bacterium]
MERNKTMRMVKTFLKGLGSCFKLFPGPAVDYYTDDTEAFKSDLAAIGGDFRAIINANGETENGSI